MHTLLWLVNRGTDTSKWENRFWLLLSNWRIIVLRADPLPLKKLMFNFWHLIYNFPITPEKLREAEHGTQMWNLTTPPLAVPAFWLDSSNESHQKADKNMSKTNQNISKWQQYGTVTRHCRYHGLNQVKMHALTLTQLSLTFCKVEYLFSPRLIFSSWM